MLLIQLVLIQQLLLYLVQQKIVSTDLDAALNGGTLTDGTEIPTGLLKGTQTVQAGLNEVNAKVNGGTYATVVNR